MLKVGDTLSLEDALSLWGRAAAPVVTPLPADERPAPSCWYVIVVAPRREARAVMALNDAGFQTYLPTVKIDRRVSRRCQRWKRFENPMFPRYVFASADIDVNRTKGLEGVVDYLRDDARAALVSNSAIEVVKAAEDMRVFDRLKGKSAIFEPGEHVRVVEGVFKTFPAVVRQALLGEDAEVAVKIFGQETVVSMPVEYLSR